MTEITFTSEMGVELIDHMGSDETVAQAARVSTGKDLLKQDKIEGLINYLVRGRAHEHLRTLRGHSPIRGTYLCGQRVYAAQDNELQRN